MYKISEYFLPFVFIIFGILIKYEYYIPSSRLSRMSPWFLIILGVVALLGMIYERFFSKRVKEVVKELDFKSKVCHWIAIIFTLIFLLFMFEDIFVNEAMNDIFRLSGLFGLAYCGMNIMEKKKRKS